MSVRLAYLGLLSLTAALAACSAPPSLENRIPGIPSDPPTGFSQSQASTYKNQLTTLLNGLSGSIGNGTVGLSMSASLLEPQYPEVARLMRAVDPRKGSVKLQETETCSGGGSVTRLPDNPADEDQDGIVAAYEVTASNCKEGSSTLNGFLGVRDKNDNDPASGFTVVTDLLVSSASGSGRLALGFDYTPASGGGFNVRYGALVGSGSDKIAYGMNMTYSPKSDGNADPYDAGFLSFNGRFVYKVSTGSNPGNYVLDMKGENLEHSDTCTASFIGGSAIFQDNGGNRLKVQYNGCNSVTVSYNGSVL